MLIGNFCGQSSAQKSYDLMHTYLHILTHIFFLDFSNICTNINLKIVLLWL